MGVRGREREREEREESGESKEGEEGQVAPFIVGQVYGVGHTWLLPGRCGVELRQNPNTLTLVDVPPPPGTVPPP